MIAPCLERLLLPFVTDDRQPLTSSIRKQRTIANPAVVEGFGYWSGRDVRLELRPAPVDTGVVFVRHDLDGCPRIPALVRNRVETPRRSTLRLGDACVEMVEHVMAALAGLQIDNCEVWTDQPEMPGCDGSCQAIVGALDGAGLVEQEAPRTQRVVQEVLRLGNERSWIEAAPPTSLSTTLEYRLDYGSGSPIGHQTLEIELSPESFRHELAASRTFLLEAEANAMMAEGIGLRTTCQDLLVLGENGPVDNELRFEDECVRHKILDLIGDLALAGVDLLGKFTAYRSGHRLNGELVAILAARKPPCGNLKRCA